jgi:hypothetical protein
MRTNRSLSLSSVRPEPVEGPLFLQAQRWKEGLPFDKLRANGFWGSLAWKIIA